ncbi:hypothetical protein K458DRAFT_322676 [Lentithecium fluviatile CBS 122367]|uniref:Serine hydrolase domain-containing protein n=1 Tax=Lentithecium fluviatile CBS 122367 TaxID=1168545 RepID=A0A6G1IDC8_9PLEO|nr:hypothetical protein K458DRAFT_322676 [Lentithecium fluviatile CBS 122367]
MASPGTVKPTLLAFHGSGSSATIHTVQLARLGRLLKPHLDIESLEAPFPSAAGPGILPFFEGCGPYKRWIPQTSSTLTVTPQTASSVTTSQSSSMPPEVESLVRDTISTVRAKGGYVAGLIGFSQGTRVVAGLLKGAEIARKLKEAGADGVEELDWLTFTFALSVCGSYPPPLIPPSVAAALAASSIPEEEQKALVGAKIAIPTYHVQGNADEWAWAGKLLIENSYDVGEGRSVVMEAEMGHHYPSKTEESEKLRDWVLEVHWKAI